MLLGRVLSVSDSASSSVGSDTETIVVYSSNTFLNKEGHRVQSERRKRGRNSGFASFLTPDCGTFRWVTLKTRLLAVQSEFISKSDMVYSDLHTCM